MATKNIVPRANAEGKLGTGAKKWLSVNADKVYGKIQLQDYTECTSTEETDYFPIYDSSNNEIRKISVTNMGLGSGGINTIAVSPNDCQLDDTNLGVSKGNWKNIFPSLDFGTDSDGSVWYTFSFPENWDTDKSVSIVLEYSCNGVDPSKIIKFDTEVWAVGIEDTPSVLIADYSGSDNISVSSQNIDKLNEKTLTNGSIPNAYIPTTCKTIACRFTRDADGDTYLGSLQVLRIKLTQD